MKKCGKDIRGKRRFDEERKSYVIIIQRKVCGWKWKTKLNHIEIPSLNKDKEQ